MSTPFPLALEQVVFLKSVVIAVPGHEPGELVPAPENHVEVREVAEASGQYVAAMRTILNKEADPRYPYSIEMEVMATLRADDSISKEEAARGVLITAHSVLFGAIRESVAWITSRQAYGTLTLGLSVLQPRPKAAEEQGLPAGSSEQTEPPARR